MTAWTVCPIDGAVVADADQHAAWHAAHNDTTPPVEGP